MNNCPKCGAELPEGSSFCLNCFSSLKTPDPVSVNAVKNHNRISSFLKSRQMSVVLSCLLVVVLFGLGAFLLKKGLHKVKTVSAESTSFVTVTNASGEIITNKNGEALTEAVIEVTNNNGVAVTNEDGSRVYQRVVPVTDSSGENVTNKSGEQVYEVVTAAKEEKASESTDKKNIFSWFFNSSGSDVKTDNSGGTETSSAASTAQTQGSSEPDPSVSTTESTAAASATETTSQATTEPTTAKPETTAAQPTGSVSNENVWEYDYYSPYLNGDKYLRITGYTGNESDVILPVRINGENVRYVASDIFAGSNVKTVTICTDYYSFPMFSGCTKLEAVYFDGASKFYSVDGVVFDKDNNMTYYPIGKRDSHYTTPDCCVSLSQNAVKDNPYIKTFTLSGSITGMVSGSTHYYHNLILNFKGCSSLTAINTQVNTDRLKSIDGVLFAPNNVNSSLASIAFPAGKNISYYEFPGDIPVILDENSFCGNPYLKKIKVPANSRFVSLDFITKKYGAKNIDSICLSDNEKMREYYSDTMKRWFDAYHITVEWY